MQNNTYELNPESFTHAEDLALKTAALFFGKELLSYIGIRKKMLRPAPTELIHLETRQMYQDFNYIMENGEWYHFEFESDALTSADLKRFREYEAVTSRSYNVNVTTFVICSSRVKKLISKVRVGLNTYHVNTIRLKNDNADHVYRELLKKAESEITKGDLIPVILSPLLDGKMPQKERIVKGFSWLKKDYPRILPEDLKKMQSVLYVLAGKFLTSDELFTIKEAIAMTQLGQMLLEDGIQKGIQKGVDNGIVLTKLVFKLSAKGFSEEEISLQAGIPAEKVHEILAD